VIKYSGRTTCYEHKHGDSWKNTKGAGNNCIKQVTLFDVQWSNCPVEVEEEVKKLWADNELGNDRYIFQWVGEDHIEENYPIIAEYLKNRGITECIIHWWW
jgi:hypothetical protein